MAIAEGKFGEALSIIRQTNPLPSICGRVCHHPCEEACNRKFIDEPVAVRALKRAAVDYGLSNKEEPIAQRTGQARIAIVGSGPAGLTAAHDLVRKGWGVCIYEAMPIAGGLLSTAIPEFILPQQVVQADVDYIKKLGVVIKTNTAIGRDLSIDDLFRLGFKAVLIATGAQESAKLPLPGVDLDGVFYALPFLRQVKLRERHSLEGRIVVVIGGGNVAVDAARVAVRLRAKEVHVACLESRAEMPAYPWEIEAAMREGVKFHPSLAPQRFKPRDGNKVDAIDFKRVSSFERDRTGRISWTLMEGPGSDYSMRADVVIIAIGQVPTPPDGGTKLNLDPKGAIEVNKDTLATNVPGVFAAGDVVSAPGTVVESMAAGRRAANSIDQYLRGMNFRGGQAAVAREVFKLDPKDIPPFMYRRRRWQVPTLAPTDATRSFQECTLGYTEWQAIEEAKRCLNCRMCGSCIFKREQLCIETARRLIWDSE